MGNRERPITPPIHTRLKLAGETAGRKKLFSVLSKPLVRPKRHKKITPGSINLGGTEDTPPTEPGVLGTKLQSAQTSLVGALNVYAAALGALAPLAPVTNGQAATAAGVLSTALTAYSTAVTASLSGRVKLE